MTCVRVIQATPGSWVPWCTAFGLVQSLSPSARNLVPDALLRRVRGMITQDFTLPPDEVLLYTRALHKSLEPLITTGPTQETFEWHVPPPTDGIPFGRV